MTENNCKQPIANTESDGECCCGLAANNNIEYRSLPVTGIIQTPQGPVEIVSTRWRLEDYTGMIAVRIGINRMNYAVKPGLYAVGKPSADSPVLVSANYKLSFDILRRELAGHNLWILVIDTKGVNVWCAAGKGTFGTMELSRRVMMTGLSNIVTHRTLILPQLGAPGVSAHMVKSFCEFAVIYGPVRAKDISRFLSGGLKADPRMRRVSFNLADRVTVSWLELALLTPKGIIISLLLWLLLSINKNGFSPATGLTASAWLIALLWLTTLTGTVLSAALLPYLPGKAFSLKGGVTGFIVTLLFLVVIRHPLSVLGISSLLLLSSALSAFLALNFTGSSTFTSLSGVQKEMKYSIPVIIAMTAAGTLLGLVDLLRKVL